MSFDQNQVASLIKQFGNANIMLADAYINGSIFIDDNNQNEIEKLKKTGILRIADHSNEFRLSTDIKRLIDRLLLRNLRYRQNTDMNKVIKSVEDDIEDYRYAFEHNEKDNTKLYLERIDDNLYESMEMLENSLSVMFSAITSQFGFVNSLASKIRENERALAYAQQLVKELNQINLHTCYDWFNWAAPPELSQKIIRFIDQYKSIVERLASIVDRMKTLLFTLRLQEKTANRTRALAQFLKQHPEWEPKDWSNEQVIPPLLKRGTGLRLNSAINTKKTTLQADFISIIQELKRQTKPVAVDNTKRESIAVKSEETAIIEHQRDAYETHVETLFAQAIKKQGKRISALDYWNTAKLDIAPSLWLDLVFAQHCCLQQNIKQVIAMDMEGDTLSGFNGNQLISEIHLHRVK